MPPSGAAKVPLSGYELMNRRQCGRPAVVWNQSRCLLKWYKALKSKLSKMSILGVEGEVVYSVEGEAVYGVEGEVVYSVEG